MGEGQRREHRIALCAQDIDAFAHRGSRRDDVIDDDDRHACRQTHTIAATDMAGDTFTPPPRGRRLHRFGAYVPDLKCTVHVRFHSPRAQPLGQRPGDRVKLTAPRVQMDRHDDGAGTTATAPTWSSVLRNGSACNNATMASLNGPSHSASPWSFHASTARRNGP